MYQFRCPHCRVKLGQKSESSVGREKPCPKCEARFVIPAPGGEAILVAAGKPVAAKKATSVKKAPAKKPASSEPQAGRPPKRSGGSRKATTPGGKRRRAAGAAAAGATGDTVTNALDESTDHVAFGDDLERAASPGRVPESFGDPAAFEGADSADDFAAFNNLDNLDHLDGLDEFGVGEFDGGAAGSPVSPPPKAGKKKKKQPLRPRKHVEDYDVVETAEDRMAKLGGATTGAENVLAQRIFWITVISIGCLVLAPIIRAVLLLGTADVMGDQMDRIVLAELAEEMTDEEWAEMHGFMVEAYGEKWTDAHFDEVKEMMLAGEYPDEDYFPDGEEQFEAMAADGEAAVDDDFADWGE